MSQPARRSTKVLTAALAAGGTAARVVMGDKCRNPVPWSWAAWKRQAEFMREHDSRQDLFRNLEYAFAEQELQLAPGMELADIGTGHTIFGAYMAKRTGARLTIIDIDNYCEEFQKGVMQKAGVEDVRMIFQDATATGLPDASFDRIAAVSVIEHFPGDGDVRFVREAYRLLKPGGILVITVPASAHFQENEQVSYYHGFERRYDPAAVRERLCEPAPFGASRIVYMTLAPDTWAGAFLTRKYGSLNNFFAEWYLSKNHEKYDRHCVLMTRSLLHLVDEPDADICGAMVALRKPAAE